MYQKTHYKLTFIFTAITTFIMLVMSVIYLQMSEHTLRQNGRLSFSSDMNTLINTFEQQREISHEWLSKMESNGNYIIAAYDNGVPFAFNHRNTDAAHDALIKEVFELCATSQALDHNFPRSFSYQSIHKEFTYHSSDYGSYYVCNTSISGNAGIVQLIVLSKNLQNINEQLEKQRLLFIFVIFLVAVILFVFSWCFTKKILRPIEVNQQKQIQFVASASHELRTPLAVILSSISAIRKADSKKREHFYSIIESEGHQMANLIGDMLTLASADSHGFAIAKVPTELDTLCLNCYEAFTPIAQENRIHLTLHLPDDSLPLCVCDEKRIRQVITILLHNACSYGRPDGLIELSLTNRNHQFMLRVSDNGTGISDEDKKHIFERFYRSPSKGGCEGHFGLGLCVAKEIVDAHNGHISVSDCTGGGTVFSVVLPG